MIKFRELPVFVELILVNTPYNYDSKILVDTADVSRIIEQEEHTLLIMKTSNESVMVKEPFDEVKKRFGVNTHG